MSAPGVGRERLSAKGRNDFLQTDGSINFTCVSEERTLDSHAVIFLKYMISTLIMVLGNEGQFTRSHNTID